MPQGWGCFPNSGPSAFRLQATQAGLGKRFPVPLLVKENFSGMFPLKMSTGLATHFSPAPFLIVAFSLHSPAVKGKGQLTQRQEIKGESKCLASLSTAPVSPSLPPPAGRRWAGEESSELLEYLALSLPKYREGIG